MDMLEKKILMQDCKPMSTPMTTSEKLSKDDDFEKIDEGLYRSLIGSLLYLTTSRPDTLFAISVLSRFMHSPSEKHFSAAKRVLRYIKGTVAFGVQFSKFVEGDLKLLGYSNSDWGGCVDGSRSTLGYLFSLGSGFFHLELKETRNHNPIHNRGRIHCCCICCKSSFMVKKNTERLRARAS